MMISGVSARLLSFFLLVFVQIVDHFEDDIDHNLCVRQLLTCTVHTQQTMVLRNNASAQHHSAFLANELNHLQSIHDNYKNRMRQHAFRICLRFIWSKGNCTHSITVFTHHFYKSKPFRIGVDGFEHNSVGRGQLFRQFVRVLIETNSSMFHLLISIKLP